MSKANPLDAALNDGWVSACRLYEHLATGGDVPVLPPSALRLQPNEIRYGDAILGYSRLYGMNVTYNQSNSFWFGSTAFVAAGMAADAIGNASARRKAEAMAAVQWRDHAHVRTSLTSERFLCDYMGRWLSFWHNGVVEFACDLSRWSFVLRYEVGEPLMLHGPAAPWFAVATARIIYGAQGLQLPAFAPLAAAVAGARQSTITGEIVGPGTPEIGA
ncbi:hypothetical protein [Longispora albida]|uniref:hypothetical protein n=1 Tax=Longispora albida TaxID=203523 RepID=UPI000371FB7A|nr:hypothetical protein [Longispora albida]